MADIPKLPRWLGLTRQQLEILEAILRVQKTGRPASPKAIIDEDADFRKSPKIQKSNFFAQLKTLQSMGFVQRRGEASYTVNFGAIEASLERAQEKADGELAELKTARKEAEHYFRQASMGEKKPSVAFYDYGTVYSKVSQMLKTSCAAYIAGPFPRILYSNSPCLLYTPDVGNYARTLWEKCIQNHETELTYLSQFDLEYLFRKLFACYKNPTLAYGEIKMILGSLEGLLKQHPSLHMYCTESPNTLDIMLPDVNEADEFFLIIRDEQKRGIGGIYINSPELTLRFRELFGDECKRATDLRTDKGKAMVRRMERKLERIYEKYKRKKP